MHGEITSFLDWVPRFWRRSQADQKPNQNQIEDFCPYLQNKKTTEDAGGPCGPPPGPNKKKELVQVQQKMSKWCFWGVSPPPTTSLITNFGSGYTRLKSCIRAWKRSEIYAAQFWLVAWTSSWKRDSRWTCHLTQFVTACDFSAREPQLSFFRKIKRLAKLSEGKHHFPPCAFWTSLLRLWVDGDRNYIYPTLFSFFVVRNKKTEVVLLAPVYWISQRQISSTA